MTLYDPAHFEPLTDEPWDEARVRDAIRAIVADADAAFDADTLWPAHEWDGWQAKLPLKNLYVGAAGVLWALDELCRLGHAETRLDLASAAVRALELWRAEPDFMEGETRPQPEESAFFLGESGILLVTCRIAPSAQLADDLLARVRANVANHAEDIFWGTPGTLLAAAAMRDWTGEERWAEAARESAQALAGRRDGDGLWTQRHYGNDVRSYGAPHGLVGNVSALLHVEDERNDELMRDTAALLARTGDERWLERARRFAVHALAQVERLRAENGRGRYTLWTGDAGVALFAAGCLAADARYPVLD